MDSNQLTIAECQNVFESFQKEWYDIVDEFEYEIEDDELYEFWKEFISNKDLGIICTLSTDASEKDEYAITDERKWFINKIKYGF